MKISEVQRVPAVNFRVRDNGQWAVLTSDDVFKGRSVVVFSLPGAFTPTCSSSHVPRFNELAPSFRRAGIDEIVCISVNDPFVMEAWQRDQGASRIRFLPDGNGEFTAAMGMLVDKRDLGFGMRSWRYAMVVRDGVIEKMFVEPEIEGDPYQVSDADTVLRWLAPDVRVPPAVTVFSRVGCPHCARAKRLLDEHGIEFEEIILDGRVTARSLRAVAGVDTDTVPQVYVDGRRIGGADDLERHLRRHQSLAA